MRDVVAILHNIRSIHNVASMFRTADGAGITKILLTGITPGPLDRFEKPIQQFRKVSLGAETSVAWSRHRSLAGVIKTLKQEGYSIVAIEQHRSSKPYTTTLTEKKIALVMGSEPDGLPVMALNQCDHILELPMRGKKESLNVSVAFGIAAYTIIDKKRAR